MVNKPKSRRKPSHRRTYLAIATAMIVILIIGGWYAYTILNPPAKPSLVYARIDTSMGSFEVELFNSSAPKTVANFVNLVNSGFYTNLTWHRIEKNFVIQTGDPTTKNGRGNRSTWGEGSSGVQIPFEDTPYPNNASYLAMASTGPKVGGTSQFFINLANNTSLNGDYAVFGKVIGNGMSVVDAIGNVLTEPVVVAGVTIDEPVTPVLIYNITIISQP